MRVIAGTARSLVLKTPEGMNTRPTTDRIKETLFNVLQTDVPGAVFVDLFAGSGGIGIEALSRGAEKAYFVDTDKTAIGCIEYNLKHTKMFDKSMVLKSDAISALSYNIREAADTSLRIRLTDRALMSRYWRRLLEARQLRKIP